jgi:hypothetical protein
MNRFEEALFHSMDAAEALARNTDNPRHRTILNNYRKHVHLEGSGQFEKIVSPDMMVAHPVYRIIWGKAIVLEGKDQVLAFYNSLTDAVLWNTDEVIAVADWGFASELALHQLVPGSYLVQLGFSVTDVAATYHFWSRQAFIWPYSEDGKLIGEHIYEDISTRAFEKVDPADVITPQRAAEIQKTLLARLEQER